jgi:hypothetical protein
VDEMQRPYNTHGEYEEGIQIVVVKPRKGRELGTPRHKWEDDIRIV